APRAAPSSPTSLNTSCATTAAASPSPALASIKTSDCYVTQSTSNYRENCDEQTNIPSRSPSHRPLAGDRLGLRHASGASARSITSPATHDFRSVRWQHALLRERPRRRGCRAAHLGAEGKKQSLGASQRAPEKHL